MTPAPAPSPSAFIGGHSLADRMAMGTNLTETIRTAVWQRQGVRGWLGWLALQPAAGLFAVGVGLRDLAYATGVWKQQHAALPVVSVGNLTVGGTGKTPVTLWLAERLRRRGRRPAILLRGYGGSAREVTVVSRGNGPEVEVIVAGDEAVMLAKSFAGPVITATRRWQGTQAAIDLGCDLVVLDDGFQHRALARDFDLVLVAGHVGGMLPSGPMRERWGALQRADAVALVTKAGQPQPPRSAIPASLPSFDIRFEPSALVSAEGGRWQESPLQRLSGARVAVVCGIAEPGPFFAAIGEWETTVTQIYEFADHHRYTIEDWQRINRDTRDAELVVTTEKDLVKLEDFPFERGKLVALRVMPRISDEERLLEMIEAKIRDHAEGR